MTRELRTDTYIEKLGLGGRCALMRHSSDLKMHTFDPGGGLQYMAEQGGGFPCTVEWGGCGFPYLSRRFLWGNSFRLRSSHAVVGSFYIHSFR